MGLKMSAEEVMDLIAVAFPQVKDDFAIEKLRDMGIVLRLKVAERHLRPGGTVSGPSMFSLADCAAYLAILGNVGPEALAVTTSCSMDFMRKPEAGADLIADCTLLKLGRVLAVAEILIRSEGTQAPVARASMTYSRPPKQA